MHCFVLNYSYIIVVDKLVKGMQLYLMGVMHFVEAIMTLVTLLSLHASTLALSKPHNVTVA